jgi:hypothetical protein
MPRALPILLLCLGIGAAGVRAQDDAPRDGSAPEPGSELRVWLFTAGPGEAVWERFGHNAIRVLDTETGEDVAYNWGIFDFNQVDFLPRFLKGQMLYMMAAFSTGPMVNAYAQTGREIVLQELDLTPAQRIALRDFANRNAQPENRDYFYNYFLDNCSTRVRDLLDLVLGGALGERFIEAPTGTSFRYHIRRLTRSDPLLYTGMDVLLGTPGDRPISVWEEMFLPMTLRDAIRNVTVVDENGVERPLVLAEELVAAGTGSPVPEAPPRWFAGYLGLGLLLGGLLAWSGSARARGSRAAGAAFVGAVTLWSLVAGLVGTILVLVLFTDHRFMMWNENLLLLTPLSLGLAVLVPLSRTRPGARRVATRLAGIVAVLAAAALLPQVVPAFRQQNAIFLGLVLPTHLGLWWGLRATR